MLISSPAVRVVFLDVLKSMLELKFNKSLRDTGFLEIKVSDILVSVYPSEKSSNLESTSTTSFKYWIESSWAYNDAEHRNLADAFELRLFSSYIAKVSNPDDEWLVDIYGGDPYTGILASEWKAFELLEFEHNLWEF